MIFKLQKIDSYAFENKKLGKEILISDRAFIYESTKGIQFEFVIYNS